MKEVSFTGKINADINIPGSKYIANRVITIAALGRGKSSIRNIPDNRDIQQALKAYRQLGINIDKHNSKVRIQGAEGKFNQGSVEIHTGESGTLMRFITAVATLAEGNIRITGSRRIKERPVGELVDSLTELGAEINKENGDCPPVLIKSQGLEGGYTKINGAKSSQYISALLLVGCYAKQDVEIEITGKSVSSSYIDLTREMINKFGVQIDKSADNKYFIKAGQSYKAQNFTIPADWSSANFFFAAAAITGGKITINNLDLNSSQGESRFVDVLAQMGCQVIKREDRVTLEGPQKLKGIEIDMGSIPDAVPALSAVAAFCKEDTLIHNIAHLRYKESDRIKAIDQELSKLGIRVDSRADEIIINGKGLKNKAVTFEPRNDHRIAMSMALIGLRVPGIKIGNPECVNKSFPGYWNKLQEIGVDVREV
jgi:3-phosphoshikimate 1-carboxyvinyltransferase